MFMKLHLCTSQVTLCTCVNKILNVDTQYTAKVKNLWNKFAQPMISLNWRWIIIYYLHFIHQFKWTPFSCHFLDLRISFPGLRSRMFYVLRKEIKMFFLNSEGNLRQYLKKKNRRYKNVISPVNLIWLVYL